MIRVSILFVALSAVSLFAAVTPVNVLMKFETSTAGTVITPTIITNSSVGVTGPWRSVDFGPFTAMFISDTNLTTSDFIVSVGGTSYDGNGTRGLTYDHFTAPDYESMLIDLPVAASNFVFGAFVKFNAGPPGGGSYIIDLNVIYGNGGVYCVCQERVDAAGNATLNAHADNGGTTYGSGFAIQTNKLYWITQIRDPDNTQCVVKLYDPANHYALVGTSTASMSAGDKRSYYFILGDNWSQQLTDHTLWDNVVLAWGANAVFPLLPFADIIPDHRKTDWTLAGVRGARSGGITNRSDIFSNVKVSVPGSAAVAVGDGVTDDRLALYDAFRLATNGSVVYLPAGNYRVASSINIARPNEITIRGETNAAGALLSRIMLDNTSQYGMIFGNGSGAHPNAAHIFSLHTGYTKGSSNLATTAAHGFTNGMLVTIDQTNDYNFVTSVGAQGTATTNTVTYADVRRNGTRNLAHTARVISVADLTNLVIWPPLNWDFKSALNPQVCRYEAGDHVTLIGVENLIITNIHASSGNTYMFGMWGADRCWLKNVEIARPYSYAAHFVGGANSEIRDSYFHHGIVGQTTYGIEARFATSFLIENNIFDYFTAPLSINSGCQGFVVAYNFVTNIVVPSSTIMNESISLNHGAHPMMNLYEGNVTAELQADFYFGSGSHSTMFRNRLTGMDAGSTQYRSAIKLDRNSLSNNAVGNIIGTDALSTWVYRTTTNAYSYDIPVEVRLGYPFKGNNSYSVDAGAPFEQLDTNVQHTLLWHHNWTYKTASNSFDASIAVTNMLASYIYTNAAHLTAQYWWSNGVPSPPIGPEVSGRFNLIPAQLRYAAITTSPVVPIAGLNGSAFLGGSVSISQ